MKIPNRLIEFLNQNQVRYEILHHPVAYTAQELCAIEGIPGHEHAKVVIIKAGQKCCMAVLPSDHRVQLDKFEAIFGQPASVATEDDFREIFPDCAIGTMPPFGGLYGVATYVDRNFTRNERIAFEAGTHSDAIKMSYEDFARLAQPQIADFAFKPVVARTTPVIS